MSEARAWFEIGRAYEQIVHLKGWAEGRKPGFPMGADTAEDKAKRQRLSEDIQIEVRAYEYALARIDSSVERAR